MIRTDKQVLISLGVLLIVGWIGWKQVHVLSADLLPIKYVRIEGAFQYITKDRIKKILINQVSKGLYSANIIQIQKSVNQLPWIKKVKVKRVWPDAIDIKIIEQNPVVRWGEKGLLNLSGDMFLPLNIKKFSHLPRIEGPGGNQKKLFEIMQGIEVSLADQKLKLAEFKVNERRAWNIRLTNKMELKLGRNDPLNKFQRFLQTLALLGDEIVKKVKVVDLRYPNGYALTWKQGEEIIDWKKLAEIKKI